MESHGKPRPFKSDDLEQTSPPCPSAACPPTIDIEIEAHQSEQLVKGLSPDTKPDTEEQKEYDKTVLPEREVFINRPSLPTFSNADQQPSQKSKEQDVDEDKGLETSSLEMVVDNPNESQTLQTTHTFLINPQESRPTPPETTQEKHESANSLDITTSNSTSQDLASHSGSESHVESKHMVSISFAPQIKKPLMMEVTPDTDDARFLNTVSGDDQCSYFILMLLFYSLVESFVLSVLVTWYSDTDVMKLTLDLISVKHTTDLFWHIYLIYGMLCVCLV